MKILLFVVVALVSMATVHSLYISVPSFYQGVNRVEDEDLLEKALERALYPLGAKDVDVDGLDHHEGTFKVSITTDSALSQESKANLWKSLNDLGFKDAKLQTVSLEGRADYFGEVKDRFLVQLNLSTMSKIMTSFAVDVLRSMDSTL